MSAFAWEQLEGSIFGQKYSLEALVSVTGDQAWFDASLVGEPGKRVTLTCFPAEGRQPAIPLTHLEHPHLRAILDAGQETLQGYELRYIAMEPADSLLSDCLAAHGGLSTTDVRQLARQLTGALEYLHRQGLVYCNLTPSTIADTGGIWKLADFAGVRQAGKTDPKQIRLLPSSPQSPPEASNGVVSPAWDVYSLGITLRECLLGGADRIPDPFELVVRRCLEPKPEQRITLPEVVLIVGLPAGIPQHRVRADRARERAAAATGSSARRPRKWLRAGALAAAATLPGMLFLASDRTAGTLPAAIAQAVALAADRPAIQRAAVVETGRDQEIAKKQIAALLEKWIATFRNLDVQGHVECYAPLVAPFNGTARADKQAVRREKQWVFAGIEQLRTASIGRIRFESIEPDRAVISLEKQWVISGANASAGVEQERLTIRFIDGEWKIAGEDESDIRLIVL